MKLILEIICYFVAIIIGIFIGYRLFRYTYGKDSKPMILTKDVTFKTMFFQNKGKSSTTEKIELNHENHNNKNQID